jgi:3-hexulose-6-phosphate synthase
MLQLALDFVEMDQALRLVEQTERYVDIVEVGTPLLLREGIQAIRRIRTAYPHIRLLADAKIVDGGYDEARMLFEAGANLVTVLAVASPETLRAVHSAAVECGGQVAADLIASVQLAGAIEAVTAAGIDIICAHRAVDRGAWEVENSRVLEEIVRNNRPMKIMVAGGIGLETIPSILPIAPDIVVVGNSIVKAKDPADAAQRIGNALRR